MHYPYRLCLAPGVTLIPTDDGLAVARGMWQALVVKAPSPAARRLLDQLADGGGRADDLCRGGDTAHLHYLLLRLGGRGLLSYAMDGAVTARLDPLSFAFAFRDGAIRDGAMFGRWRLSRFACLRRVDEQAVVECPLGHGRVRLWGAAGATMVGLLTGPCTVQDIAAAVPGASDADVAAFLGLLVNARAAMPCGADGRLPEDDDDALRQWEFHDLLFHARSRDGRHGEPIGGTFRFLDEIPPLPAIKPPMSDRRIPLPDGDATALNVPFHTVLKGRRSIRGKGRVPLSLESLSAFLHHVNRASAIDPPDPARGAFYEVSCRPCPSGGATHSLDLYLTVGRVTGLEPGLYHYAPGDHALERLANLDGPPARLLSQAAASAAMEQPPDVLVTLATRFARLAWKYQSVAYALALKDAGVLIHQMYLVATALGLSPCAIGAGNPDLFAEATGLDFFQETSVAEFILSGGPDETGR